MLDSYEGEIAKLVLNVCSGNVSEDYLSKTTIGRAFMNAIKREQEHSSQGEFLSPEEKQFVEKVKFLKVCEQKNDIGWIDAESWFTLPISFKSLFVDLTDPLDWGGGVYFQYSRLHQVEQLIYRQLEIGTCLMELKEGLAYHLVYNSLYNSSNDRLNDTELKKKQKTFNTNLVRSIGLDHTGALIVKNYGGQCV